MITNPTISSITDPQGIDFVLSEFQDKLEAALSWLTKAYGKSYRLVRELNDNDFSYPGVITSGKEYLSMLPDSHLGNYCFFTLDDETFTDYTKGAFNQIERDFSLIFFFDLRDIYPSWETRTIEHVKAEILTALRSMSITSGQFRLSNVYERAEDVFEGFTVQEVRNQFLMRPYGALRFEGTIYYKQKCT